MIFSIVHVLIYVIAVAIGVSLSKANYGFFESTVITFIYAAIAAYGNYLYYKKTYKK